MAMATGIVGIFFRSGGTVDDLDELMAQLQAAGIATESRPDEWDTPETGRFCRIADPEGNQIELWEPPAT